MIAPMYTVLVIGALFSTSSCLPANLPACHLTELCGSLPDSLPTSLSPLPLLSLPSLPSSVLTPLVQVPVDSFIMDLVFMDGENPEQATYDNRNGLDYHVPVVGGSVKEPPMYIVHVALEMAPVAKVRACRGWRVGASDAHRDASTSSSCNELGSQEGLQQCGHLWPEARPCRISARHWAWHLWEGRAASDLHRWISSRRMRQTRGVG